MMKIVCLIQLRSPLIYFVNRINERYEISLVVVEPPSTKKSLIASTKRLIARIKQNGISSTIEAIRYGDGVLKEKRYISHYNKYFHDKWESIDNNIPILKVEDINSQIVYERLKEERPDLILDHGTPIVKDHILETSDLALNLHWGLSPYYRGSYCTEWALIHWDPYNIGVTIHKLTRIIDGGDILAQKRAMIKPGDTVNSINMQLTQLGTELVIKAIDRIESGEQLQFKKQDYSLGFLIFTRQWGKYLRKQIEHIERNNLIEQMLKKPARKHELPIVDL